MKNNVCKNDPWKQELPWTHSLNQQTALQKEQQQQPA